MIRLTGFLHCKTEDESALVRQYLPQHQALTREEGGCLSFEVTPTADPLVWKVGELFVDKPAFDAHQARTKASEWGQETRAIVREYEISEV